MEIPERTLIGLKLILEQFGIVVGAPLTIKSDPPNMDLICSAIALMQLIHPLGYEFCLTHDEAGYHIRSAALSKHVMSLNKKSTRGDFILSGKRYAISRSCLSKIELIQHHVIPPEKVPFTQAEWIILVGMWAAMHEFLSDQAIVEVLMSDFIEFVPYTDFAEEAVIMIRSQSQRSIV